MEVLGGGLVFFGACLVLAAAVLVSVRLYQERPEFVLKVMKYGLIGVFLLGFSAASLVIGLRIDERHSSSYSRGLKSVNEIWGGQMQQYPPAFYYRENVTQEYTNEKTGKIERRTVSESRDMGMDAQKVRVKVDANVRRKGLLEYAGYDLAFEGTYTVRNFQKQRREFYFDFTLPQGAGNITGIQVELDGKPYTGDSNLANGINWNGVLAPGEERVFKITYAAKGTERFDYLLGNTTRELRSLDFVVLTDYTDVRIPDTSMAPVERAGDSEGSRFVWRGENLVTGQNIALRFELEGNYGSIAAKLFYYSPLALALFTGFLLIMNAAKQLRLHPMHFLFLLTGFFIFYLFGSYVISFVHVILGFVLALLLSTGVMLYYVKLIKKDAVLMQTIAFGAGMFQWVFSTAFFFPAYTGFLITIAAILAFVALMRSTADVDWESKW